MTPRKSKKEVDRIVASLNARTETLKKMAQEIRAKIPFTVKLPKPDRKSKMTAKQQLSIWKWLFPAAQYGVTDGEWYIKLPSFIETVDVDNSNEKG